MRRVLTAGLIALVAPYAAAQLRLAKPAIDTLPNGVIRVRNAGPSQWLGTSGWKLVLERTITADGTTGLLAKPRSLAVDSHGNIFQTDWKVDGIQVFDPSGKFLRQIGRKGDGPGEFKVPITIVIRGDTLLAYASNQSRVSLWHADGKLLREWHVDFCCGADPQFGEGGSVMVSVLVRTNGANRRGEIRWRADGTVRDTVMLPVEAPLRAWETNRGTFPIPFSAHHVGTFNSRGSYVSGFSGSYSLVVARHGSDTTRIIELPGTRATTSKSVADSVMATYARIPPLAGIAKRGDIPSQQPFFGTLLVDELDNVWVERTGPDGRAANFEVISADGAFLGTVALPPSRLQTLCFAKGRLYATTETRDGDVVIQIYRIDKGAH